MMRTRTRIIAAAMLAAAAVTVAVLPASAVTGTSSGPVSLTGSSPGVCLTAESPEPGTPVMLKECTAPGYQIWIVRKNANDRGSVLVSASPQSSIGYLISREATGVALTARTLAVYFREDDQETGYRIIAAPSGLCLSARSLTSQDQGVFWENCGAVYRGSGGGKVPWHQIWTIPQG
jgi:hypothetical protein